MVYVSILIDLECPSVDYVIHLQK